MFSPFSCLAAEIPQPIFPAGVGVNIHFVTGQEKDLDMIAAAGFKFIRMDFQWDSIETKKGEYDWSGYARLLDNLDKRGLRAILILDYSNPFYEETVTSPHPQTQQPQKSTASPRHPESIAAFANFAAESARHFTGRHILWEIWNEPNGWFWSPKPDVSEYTKLALATARAIRQADPQATIIAPALAGMNWQYIESFLKSGILENLDAVSVHPYRDPKKSPETAAPEYERLRGLIEKYAPAGKQNKIPILSGEWGYSTWKGGVSLETQAAFAARQQLINLSCGVPLSIWYDWRNDGPDPKENEHNFGTVYQDLKPKPAYVAIQTLTKQLDGYRMVRRVSLASEKDYVLVFQSQPDQQRLAAWTLTDPHTINLDGLRAGSGVSWNGEPLECKAEKSALVLQLGPMPCYVVLKKAGSKIGPKSK